MCSSSVVPEPCRFGCEPGSASMSARRPARIPRGYRPDRQGTWPAPPPPSGQVPASGPHRCSGQRDLEVGALDRRGRMAAAEDPGYRDQARAWRNRCAQAPIAYGVRRSVGNKNPTTAQGTVSEDLVQETFQAAAVNWDKVAEASRDRQRARSRCRSLRQGPQPRRPVKACHPFRPPCQPPCQCAGPAGSVTKDTPLPVPVRLRKGQAGHQVRLGLSIPLRRVNAIRAS